ncbi:MAG: hypothetical protein ABSD44_01660 [Terracidiphilus sp.]
MAVDPIQSFASGFALQVERLYAGLILAGSANPAGRSGLASETVDRCPDSQPGLGGTLLYAGELDAKARALMAAANIAGAASLAVSADATAAKQAVRDGVTDFLVTSLDEALRILKNEIRKRQTVAVCVALTPETGEADFAREMAERGVLPDLARPVEGAALQEDEALLAWRVSAAPALWLPKLDAIALECLEGEAGPARAGSSRRWLRLAPRYLGRLGQGLRLLRCNWETAARFQKQVQERVESGEIGVPVEIQWVSPPAASIRLQSSCTP